MTFDDGSAAKPLPLLDADAVVRDLGNDLEIYHEVVAMFLEDLVVVRAALAAALSVAALLPVIHEAANSLGVIGALRGAQQLRATEKPAAQRPDDQPRRGRADRNPSPRRCRNRLAVLVGPADRPVLTRSGFTCGPGAQAADPVPPPRQR